VLFHDCVIDVNYSNGLLEKHVKSARPLHMDTSQEAHATTDRSLRSKCVCSCTHIIDG
jgi:hypothetical protein